MDHIRWQPLSKQTINEIQQRLSEPPATAPPPIVWQKLVSNLTLICSILLLIHIALFPLAFLSTLIWKSLDILLWYKISA
ncbi:MAG: hypothetical protein HGA65_11855, partial [Oscillochloris sp.]|nr:hypothetical protein [Oscillochloris sp.]